MSAGTAFRNALRTLAVKFIEKRFAKKVLSPSDFNREDVNKIIVIRQHDRLRDLLLTLPVFYILRKNFPGAHITALVDDVFAPLLGLNDDIDEILSISSRISTRQISKLYKLRNQLKENYDLAIVINTVSHSLISDLSAYQTKAKYILGADHLPFKDTKRNFLYNLIAPYSNTPKHQVEHNLDYLRYLGLTISEVITGVKLDHEEKKRVADLFSENGISENDIVLGIKVSPEKNEEPWPVERYVECAKNFSWQYNAKIVLFWEQKYEALAKQFAAGLPFKPFEVVDFDLRSQADILNRCNLLLTGEIDFMHLAAAVGTPVIGLFGKVKPEHWMPLNEKFVGLIGKNGDCSTIQLRSVLKAADGILMPKSMQKPDKIKQLDISERAVDDYLGFGDIQEIL